MEIIETFGKSLPNPARERQKLEVEEAIKAGNAKRGDLRPMFNLRFWRYNVRGYQAAHKWWLNSCKPKVLTF